MLLMLFTGCAMVILTVLSLVSPQDGLPATPTEYSNLKLTSRSPSRQTTLLDKLFHDRPPEKGEVVVLACGKGCGMCAEFRDVPGIRMVPVACGGSVEAGAVQHILECGAAGVVVAACPSPAEPQPALSRFGTAVRYVQAGRNEVSRVIQDALSLRAERVAVP